MLVLTVKLDEPILITHAGEVLSIQLLKTEGRGRVKVGLSAPRTFDIHHQRGTHDVPTPLSTESE
jgi:sRNA-binding carbon storage regulator CsrA